MQVKSSTCKVRASTLMQWLKLKEFFSVPTMSLPFLSVYFQILIQLTGTQNRLLPSNANSQASGASIMQVSISSTTIPPAHPRGFAPKICLHLGAFASKLLPRGRGFVGAAPEGRAFSINARCLPFLKFSL